MLYIIHITKIIHLEKSKRLIIWDGGVANSWIVIVETGGVALCARSTRAIYIVLAVWIQTNSK